MEHEFVEFPKIPRLSREIFILEKIDGTNAQVFIDDSGGIKVGSRNRWITPEDDNYGFARWVEGNKAELLKLGDGRHYGEWWGSGIQRGYGKKNGEKIFSLFNAARWANKNEPLGPKQQHVPDCCSVVPILYRGAFCTESIEHTLYKLQKEGSVASPGFPNPEGIIIYHTASGAYFKKTILNDSQPKTLVQ